MLVDLSIENLGVIPSSALSLSPGLSVLTGETGAGKTMVVSGLRLLCGARADAGRVRSGSKQATVEGSFDISALPEETQQRVLALVEGAGGVADENGEILANRVVAASGRSRAHLGGRSVPAANLASFAAEVLTIHGQNDQLRLLAEDKQRDALDRFAPAIAPLRSEHEQAYRAYKQLEQQLRERTEKRRELAQEVDRLQFAIDEIAAVDPQPGEDELLVQQVRRLQDVDALHEQALEALVCVDGAGAAAEFGDGAAVDDVSGASELLGRAVNALQGSDDTQLRELATQLADMTSALSGISAELGSFITALPSDPAELDTLLQRQQQLKQLTRKYAPDAAGVVAWREKAEQKLASIDVSSEALEQLKRDVAKAEKTMQRTAKALSKARKLAGEQLEALVTEELHGLAMPKAVFRVQLSPQPPALHGADGVEFQLAAAPGLEPRPLATSASGGELSRVMLALEVILASSAGGATLVFDEVDAGVGGRAAVEIGRRLARLAQHNQVIVVTHLPQVAAFADTHIHVSKDVSDEAVVSAVRALEGTERVEELARMLAGLDDTATGRAHAQELLDAAAKAKAALK